MRLDSYLVENNLVETRNKAQALIKDEMVYVNNKVMSKNSYEVTSNDTVDVRAKVIYVSRAGLKLREFFDEVYISLDNKACLDIGSSTGGFAQVLLQHNVASIVCVDVGTNQLHDSIKNHPKVTSHENCDIRSYNSEAQYDVITCDVSFISVLHILDAINRLAKEDIIILFKPQFEVGKDVKRDKNGVVKDEIAVQKALAFFHQEASKYGWVLQQQRESKVAGKDGNREYFFYYRQK